MYAFYVLLIVTATAAVLALVLGVALLVWWLVDTRREAQRNRTERPEERCPRCCNKAHIGPEDCETW